MNVVRNSDIAFDPVLVQRLAENINRVSKRRQVRLQKFTVTTGGARFDHRLGRTPVHVSITPMSEMTWWYYREPDSTSLYLKSSADGDVLISVSGE